MEAALAALQQAKGELEAAANFIDYAALR